MLEIEKSLVFLFRLLEATNLVTVVICSYKNAASCVAIKVNIYHLRKSLFSMNLIFKPKCQFTKYYNSITSLSSPNTLVSD